jgi:DNA-binding transcriptional LysR family regulator
LQQVIAGTSVALTVANTLLSVFLARFLMSRPELQVSLLGVPSHLVAEMVAPGQADIGYAEGPLNRHGLNIQVVPMDAVVVVPDKHRLVGVAVVAPVDLSGECVIAVAPGVSGKRLVLHRLRSQRLLCEE